MRNVIYNDKQNHYKRNYKVKTNTYGIYCVNIFGFKHIVTFFNKVKIYKKKKKKYKEERLQNQSLEKNKVKRKKKLKDRQQRHVRDNSYKRNK